MKEFQGRRHFRQILYSRPVVAALLVLIVLLGVPVYKLYRQSREASAERDALLAELTRLENRKKDLEDEIERLATPRGQEEEIREKLGLALPGEGVITVIASESTTTKQEVVPEGWFASLTNFIAGLVQW